jgi:hypothetical protein
MRECSSQSAPCTTACQHSSPLHALYAACAAMLLYTFSLCDHYVHNLCSVRVVRHAHTSSPPSPSLCIQDRMPFSVHYWRLCWYTHYLWYSNMQGILHFQQNVPTDKKMWPLLPQVNSPQQCARRVFSHHIVPGMALWWAITHSTSRTMRLGTSLEICSSIRAHLQPCLLILFTHKAQFIHD